MDMSTPQWWVFFRPPPLTCQPNLMCYPPAVSPCPLMTCRSPRPMTSHSPLQEHGAANDLAFAAKYPAQSKSTWNVVSHWFVASFPFSDSLAFELITFVLAVKTKLFAAELACCRRGTYIYSWHISVRGGMSGGPQLPPHECLRASGVPDIPRSKGNPSATRDQ